MPADKVAFYNQIDIGIFLCFLELCLEHNRIDFERSIITEENTQNERNLNAVYRLQQLNNKRARR